LKNEKIQKDNDETKMPAANTMDKNLKTETESKSAKNI